MSERRRPVAHYDTPSVTIRDGDDFPEMCNDPECECQVERIRREEWREAQNDEGPPEGP